VDIRRLLATCQPYRTRYAVASKRLAFLIGHNLIDVQLAKTTDVRKYNNMAFTLCTQGTPNTTAFPKTYAHHTTNGVTTESQAVSMWSAWLRPAFCDYFLIRRAETPVPDNQGPQTSTGIPQEFWPSNLAVTFSEVRPLAASNGFIVEVPASHADFSAKDHL
jgi:hypothetical protein